MLRRTTPLLLTLLLLHGSASAQEATAVPPLVSFAGKIPAARGSRVVVSFALYSSEGETTPLWLERQEVSVDAKGAYTVHLGANDPGGLPLDLFSHGEARWLGVQPEGQPEQPRILLVAVPYALKAADADTLGGRPLSAFLLAPAEPDAAPAEPLSSTGQRIRPTLTGGSFDPSSPGPIGNVTPDTGTFTTLTANQTAWVGDANQEFTNTVATKAAPNPFCWPMKWSFPGADGTTVDDAIGWGYNCHSAPGDPYLTFSLERNWFDGNRHQFEHYMQTNTSGTPWRPFIFVASTDQPSVALWEFLIGESLGGTSTFSVNTKDGSRLLRVQKNYSYFGNISLNFDDGVQFTAPNVIRVKVGGKLLYEFNANGFMPWNPFANTVDIGTLTRPFRTGYFGTAVSTPRLTGITDSTTVTNLNADMVDGQHASDFAVRVAPPPTSTTPCAVAQWAADADYFYTCVSANVWRRAALSSW
jgi:hypothetical protein